MRLLIDESIPEQIEPYRKEFEPSTVRRQRLKGLRNGILLRAAVDSGFTVIFSADQSLRHQQNLRKSELLQSSSSTPGNLLASSRESCVPAACE